MGTAGEFIDSLVPDDTRKLDSGKKLDFRFDFLSQIPEAFQKSISSPSRHTMSPYERLRACKKRLERLARTVETTKKRAKLERAKETFNKAMLKYEADPWVPVLSKF